LSMAEDRANEGRAPFHMLCYNFLTSSPILTLLVSINFSQP
jgi:hypothetical protein